MIEIQNLSYEIGKEEILSGLNLTINSGQVVGFWGFNGVGKSTLMEIIAGIRMPEKNSIIKKDPQIEGRIGYLSQDPIEVLMPWKTVSGNITAMLGFKGQELVSYLQGFLIDPIEHNKFPCELSGGYLQRLGWACVLNKSHSLYLLDEPFSKQDSQNAFSLAHKLFANINGSEASAVVISHDPLRLIQSCHKICVLGTKQKGAEIIHELNIPLSLKDRSDPQKVNDKDLINELGSV